MTILKSIGAVVAGFVTVFVLSVATDYVFQHVGILPSFSNQELISPWLLVLTLIYRCIFTILGGYVTARLAPNRPTRHVIILGIIGTLAGITGAIAGWNLSAHWYPIALAITAFPCIWLGGKLYSKPQASDSYAN